VNAQHDIIRAWCASCGMPEPSNGDCMALVAALGAREDGAWNAEVVICPDCLGDGKETCHNPDHMFIAAMTWNEIGRLGCQVCGSDPKHKVPRGGKCDTCAGLGRVHEDDARSFCADMGYDFDAVMELAEELQ